jgi:hypothetical protein
LGALGHAHSYRGLGVIHLPVYSGRDELGGLGVYSRWNMGNWCAEV